MTRTNLGALSYTFGISGRNHKMAQNFGELLDEKTKKQFKVAEGQNTMRYNFLFKGTLMQIWKSAGMFVFI